jgi:hypothetical protein
MTDAEHRLLKGKTKSNTGKNVASTYTGPSGPQEPVDNPYNIVLLIGVAYPALYELMQMFKGGFIDYFADTGNYIDLVYIWGSIGMGVVHGMPS